MLDLYQTSADLRSAVQDLARQEQPGAALTLTRSATLAITAAGTTITWQVEVRNQGFTWSGTDITMPTAGYYSISVIYASSGSHTGTMRLFVNTINVLSMPSEGLGSVRHAFTMTRHFQTGDVIHVNVISVAASTMQVTAEGATNETPFIHVVQLTGAV
jgi:hypothetical protein